MLIVFYVGEFFCQLEFNNNEIEKCGEMAGGVEVFRVTENSFVEKNGFKIYDIIIQVGYLMILFINDIIIQFRESNDIIILSLGK